MTRDDLDQFERWCDGTLTGAALADWTTRLAANPRLLAEIAAEARLVKRMRVLCEAPDQRLAAARVAATRTRGLLAADSPSHRQRVVSEVMAQARPRTRRWWLAAAAGLGTAAAASLMLLVWLPTGTAVAWADGVAVAPGEIPAQVRSLRFRDGSTLTIAPDSRVLLGDDPQRKTLTLTTGALAAVVTPQGDTGGFVITTPQGEARVVGTRLSITQVEDSTLLRVDEGRVALRSGDTAVEIAGGGRGLAADGRAVELPPAWRDRRPLGRLVLSQPPGPGPNTNGWLFDGQLDPRSPAFTQRMTAHIDQALVHLKSIDAQGLLLYTVEGGAIQPGAGFVGDPRRVVDLAPEFDAIADGLFARIRAAGLASGVTVTPWRLVQQGGRWIQVADPATAEAELSAKIAYAEQRWGCTLFYVNVASPGLPAGIRVPSAALRAVAMRYPQVLLVVENAGPADALIAGVQVLGTATASAGAVNVRLPWFGANPDAAAVQRWRAAGEILMIDAAQAEQARALRD